MADEPISAGSLVDAPATSLVDTPVAQPAEPSSTPEAAPPAPVVEGPWIKEDGSFVADWHKHLPEDVRAEAETQKLSRYGSVTDLARGFLNSQRLIGKKGVFIPNEKSPPEEVSEFRKALGVPETLEGYQVKPDQLPEGMGWNDDDAKPFIAIAHKHHVTPKAMKELVAAHVARQAELGKRMQQAQVNLLQQKFDAGMADLKASWGRDFDTNMIEVKKAAIANGTPLETPGFLDPAMAKLVLRLKKMISDDKFVAAGASTGAMNSVDPEKLALAITQDSSHPDYAAYHAGNKDVQNKVEGLFREAERIKERARR